MTEPDTEIVCTLFDRKRRTSERIERADLAARIADPDSFAWVEIQGPRLEVLHELAGECGIDLSDESGFGKPEILPRLVERDDHIGFFLYEVMHPARHLDTRRALEPIEFVRLQVVLGESVVFTFHRSYVEAVADVARSVCSNFSLAGQTPGFVVFLLLQESLYDVAHLNLANDNYLDELAVRVREPGERSLPQDVSIAGGNILVLKKLATSMHIVLMRLATKRSPFVSEASVAAFLVMMENALAIRETIDSSRQLLDSVLAGIQTDAANRTSEIARVLTVISGVLLPMTVVAGVYGMNFDNMPETKTEYGYFVALGAMALIGLGQVLLFRRLGWFGHPKSIAPRQD